MAHARETGSTSMLVLGVLVGAAFLVAILGAVGAGFVAHAELQQAADLAAGAAEREKGDGPGGGAERLARANGAQHVEVRPLDDGRVKVVVRRRAEPVFGARRGMMLEATAFAILPAESGAGDAGPNPPGVYSGPLVQVDSARLCPRVASSYLAMEASAAREGVTLTATSGFRSWAEQASLFAALGPRLAAPPGSSRHHDATELDIATGAAGSPVHAWLRTHGPGFGWIQRYSWEPWHWGNVRGC